MYTVTIGVKGASEDSLEGGDGLLHAKLFVSGESINVFSLAEAKARANAKTHGYFGASPY